MTPSDSTRTDIIKREIRAASQEVRQQHPWLRHQDAIGAAIMATAIAGMLGCAWLYLSGLLPWWLCIPLVALFASLTHELEHDLIHGLYFRKRPWAWHLMMALGWLARPSTISPWSRKRMHLHHHKHSGTPTDLEEQAITNGERWGLRRLLMTGDQMLAIYLRPLQMFRIARRYVLAQNPKDRAERAKLRREQTLGYFPLGLIYYTLWHGFLIYHAVTLGAAALGTSVAWPAWVLSAMPVVNVLAVVWLAPNALRTFSLHFISSNMHYFGDIEDGNIVQQCQVLNVWWLVPFQLFCFNFGSTHAIHHFVVGEPFYIRQLTARRAHRVMREQGVRFNDLGTFQRANRWESATAA